MTLVRQPELSGSIPVAPSRPASPRTLTGTDCESTTAPPSWSDVAALATRFEDTPPEEVVTWALTQFGSGLALVCSFQNCVLIHMATQIDAGVEVIFLDTGSHFAETLSFVEEVRAHYGLNLRMVRPGADADGWPCGSERCCELRKLVPLTRALAQRTAWMTGLKRVDTTARSGAPTVGWDSTRAMLKVNPLARWSYDDIARYEAEHHLLVHPLKERGYLSIGCRPTTRPVSPYEDPRAGRWPGTDRTECGLHGN